MLGETIPNHVYHNGEGWKDLISSTQFAPFYESPACMRWPIKRESDAFQLGTIVHQMVLDFNYQVLVLPSAGFVTKSDKEVWRNWLESVGENPDFKLKSEALEKAKAAAERANLEICDQATFDLAKDMASSVLEHSLASNMLNGGITERSFKYDWRKARPDCINGSMLIDLKTISSLRRFPSHAMDFRYPESLAWYEDVIERSTDLQFDGWAWIAVEKEPYRLTEDGEGRHRIEVWSASEELMMDARDNLNTALNDYEACKKKDVWPDYAREIKILYGRTL